MIVSRSSNMIVCRSALLYTGLFSSISTSSLMNFLVSESSSTYNPILGFLTSLKSFSSNHSLMRGISLNTVLELNFSFSDIACIVIGLSALKVANISMISFCLFVNPDFFDILYHPPSRIIIYTMGGLNKELI